jgi:hypothetical protein
MLKQKIVLLILMSSIGHSAIKSQTINDSISNAQAKKLVSWLASDRLQGRVNFTRQQLEVGTFIEHEFRECGLLPYKGLSNYYIPFDLTENPLPDQFSLDWNGSLLPSSSYICFSANLYISNKNLGEWSIIRSDSCISDSILYSLWKKPTNTLIWVDANSEDIHKLINRVKLPLYDPNGNILIVARPDAPAHMHFSTNMDYVRTVLWDVVGILPGRTKPDEIILFSAHYDHVDCGISGKSEGIYNGANDDASGTAAVLLLARYFAMRHDNGRTIAFCLFAGEELGLLGSQAFVKCMHTENIKAVINIEMIGKTTLTGKNAFAVIGSDYSNLSSILSKNLIGDSITVFNFEKAQDQRSLFQRSDNFPFFIKGIPAHSLMCSDDDDPCYHKTCDIAKSIDFNNMTRVIQAIATSCRTLIKGNDTPQISYERH